MNGADDKQNSVSLPEGLRQQFAELERRLWRVESAQAAGCAGIGLAVSYLALFVSDRIWDSPVGVRLGIASASVALLAGTLLWWTKRWIFQRRNLRALSVLVQEKYRRLGDRLGGLGAGLGKGPPNFALMTPPANRDLHEPHTGFAQPPRQEARPGVLVGRLLADSV